MSKRAHLFLRVVVAVLALPDLSPPVAAGSFDYVVYAGIYDTVAGSSTKELGFEARRPRPWGVKRLSWVAGAAATTDEAAWIYTGVVYEFELGERWAIGPGFAVSLWDRGDGKDLGGPVEFRSSLELSARVSARSRVGLLFYHLSNNDYYDLNPGSNSLVVSWTFAPRRE
jgi:hypothetical protein